MKYPLIASHLLELLQSGDFRSKDLVRRFLETSRIKCSKALLLLVLKELKDEGLIRTP